MEEVSPIVRVVAIWIGTVAGQVSQSSMTARQQEVKLVPMWVTNPINK
jgi:hypothetical protein